MTAQRTNYIFIDYENVHPTDLSRIKDKAAKVHLVLGSKQEKPGKTLHAQIQHHADQVQLIPTPLAGKNALDFVLAAELGRQTVHDPHGYYHLISRDKGFDALIKHLRANQILAARHDSLAGVPALMTTEERFHLLVTRLQDPAQPRPVKQRTLANTIQQLFNRSLNPDVVDKAILLLEHQGILTMSPTGRVTYPA